MGGSSTPMGMVASAPFGREQSFIVGAERDLVGQEGSEAFSMPLIITAQELAAPVFAADPAVIIVNDRTGEENTVRVFVCTVEYYIM